MNILISSFQCKFISQISGKEKLKQWKNQINKLKKKVFDAEGNPIDEESKEFIEYEKLLNVTSNTKLKNKMFMRRLLMFIFN